MPASSASHGGDSRPDTDGERPPQQERRGKKRKRPAEDIGPPRTRPLPHQTSISRTSSEEVDTGSGLDRPAVCRRLTQTEALLRPSEPSVDITGASNERSSKRSNVEKLKKGNGEKEAK